MLHIFFIRSLQFKTGFLFYFLFFSLFVNVNLKTISWWKRYFIRVIPYFLHNKEKILEMWFLSFVFSYWKYRADVAFNLQQKVGDSWCITDLHVAFSPFSISSAEKLEDPSFAFFFNQGTKLFNYSWNYQKWSKARGKRSSVCTYETQVFQESETQGTTSNSTFSMSGNIHTYSPT